jgi:CHAT domain-containing protein
MSGLSFAFALSALVAPASLLQAQRVPPENPRAILRHATAAVRGDSVSAVRTRWAARLARDSSDRPAAFGLATLARLTYDYPSAEHLYRRLAAPDSSRSDAYAMYARLGLGEQFNEYGRMVEVDRLFGEALRDARTLRDRAAEGEALLRLGDASASFHGLTRAMAQLDSALRVLPADALALRVTCRCRRAHLLVVMGRPGWRAELKAAAALARRLGEPRAEAPCVRARAIELGHRGQADSAASAYGAFAEALGRAGDHSARARILAWQAEVLLGDLADYGEAREVLYQAQAEAERSHNLYAAALTRLYLGQLFLSLNDLTPAAAYLDQAVAASGEVADSEALMVSRSWRALVSLAGGDFPRARRETLGTVEFFRQEGDLENQSEVAKTLANIAIRERDWAAAERALDDSEALLRRLGTSAWRIEQPFERGRLALYRGDPAVAERAFSRYLAGLDSTEHLQRFEARAYLADCLARRGELDGAERQLAAASDELDRWRGTLSAQDLRVAAFQANASAQNDRNASVARVLAALAAGGRADAAFALAERRRARELRDRLLQSAALETPRTRGPGRVRERGPALVTAADVAALLPDEHTALVEYVTGALGAPTTIFVLTRGRRGGQVAQARILAPADSLTGAIGRFVALVARGADAPADAQALGAALLEPAIALLGPGVTRLVIVPDGALHRVPWDVLRLGDGRYVLERYAIGIAPSAAVLGELWRRPRGRASSTPARLLAFGDPTFPAEHTDTGAPDPASESFQSAFAATGGLPRLEGSGREVRAIARYAPGAEVRLREEASESYLMHSSLTGFRILHFATHALVDDRVSFHTALALAPGNGEDGFVTPGELTRLQLAADLVVLSACRTAGGVVVDGEGVQGLTAPLLAAGARSVVATSWRVGDERTVGLVEDFYAELARGRPVIEALQTAKLEALHRRTPAAVWGAFTVFGDPLVTIPLRGAPG